MQGPSLAFIDTITTSDKDGVARRHLQENLQLWRRSGVRPLWLNTFRNRADVRSVCLVEDFQKFNRLMLEEVRSVEGVRETRTAFSFVGVANVNLLLDLEMLVLPHTETSSCYLQLRVEPGEDTHVSETVTNLNHDSAVSVVWSLISYSGHVGDISLLLLGDAETDMSEFILNHVRTIKGVVDTVADEIVDWTWMAEPDAIITLCEMFAQGDDIDDLVDMDAWDEEFLEDEWK